MLFEFNKRKIISSIIILFAVFISALEFKHNKRDFFLKRNGLNSFELDTCLDDSISSEVSQKKSKNYNQKAGDSIDSAELFQLSEKQGILTVVFNEGDTFASVLNSFGIHNNFIYAITKKISQFIKLKSINVGQKITFKYSDCENSKERIVEEISFYDKSKRIVLIKWNGSSYDVNYRKTKEFKSVKRIGGIIKVSFSKSIFSEGGSSRITNEIVNSLNSLVNFSKMKPGDAFEILYEEIKDENGSFVGKPKIKYVALMLSGVLKRFYKFENHGFLDDKGNALGKNTFLFPIKGKFRLTSPFGVRIHPTKRIKLVHKGVDYAAPKGTPIYAAASGVVRLAGYNGTYGKYIKISHNGDLATAYAHLSSISSTIYSGKRVEQGEMIGRVGSTGLSTGPHLHYELITKSGHVNPLKKCMFSNNTLTKFEKLKFEKMKKEISIKLVGLPSKVKIL